MADFIRIDSQETAVIGASVAKDEACRIIYITDGSGKMTIGDKIIPFGKNDIFAIPPETELSTASESGYRRIMIRIGNADILSQFDGVTKVSDNHKKDVRTLIAMLNRENAVYNPSHAEYIDHLMRLIVSLIAMLNIKESDRPYVERIENMLTNNLSNSGFVLDSIYSVAPDFTKDYVRRIFKQKTGMTPKAYLNNLRIKKAKELLLDKKVKYSVKQTAVACGFNDQYYFSRMFKRATGLSPDHYKRQIS